MRPTSPSSDTARARLRAAQVAESQALGKVEVAARGRARRAEALGRAEASLREAQLELVTVSGLERAAVLLDIPVERLRAMTRAQRHGSAAGELAASPRREVTAVGT